MKKVLTPHSDDIHHNKDIAAASYLWILSVIILFLRKDSHFVQFHARQGACLFVISVLFWMIPVIGIYLNILVVAFMIIGFVTAVQGEYYHMPLVYDFVIGEKNSSHFFSAIKKALSYCVHFVSRLFSGKKKHVATTIHDNNDLVSEIDELEDAIKNVRKDLHEKQEMILHIAERIEKLKKNTRN